MKILRGVKVGKVEGAEAVEEVERPADEVWIPWCFSESPVPDINRLPLLDLWPRPYDSHLHYTS